MASKIETLKSSINATLRHIPRAKMIKALHNSNKALFEQHIAAGHDVDNMQRRLDDVNSSLVLHDEGEVEMNAYLEQRQAALEQEEQ